MSVSNRVDLDIGRNGQGILIKLVCLLVAQGWVNDGPFAWYDQTAV